jgi:hypothetical protein
MGGFQNPIVGGTALRIPAIQSPDFAAGVAGWIIRIDGSAEFNDLVVRGTFNGNNFVINADGLFVYSGTPANGNLIANITADPGTDAFGNVYLAGVVSYSGPTFASLNDSNLLLGLVSQAIDAGLVGLSGGDIVFLSSPTHNRDAATISLENGLTSVTPQSAAGYPHVVIGAATAGTTAWINGAHIAASVSGGVATAETWHAPSYATLWAGATTFSGLANVSTLRYRRDAEDNVWVNGCFTATGAAGSTVCTLPAGYYNPTTLMPFEIMERQTGGGAFQVGAGYVGTTGNFHVDLGLNFTRNNGDAYYVNAKYPLGNVA